jgi:hypothetical protein
MFITKRRRGGLGRVRGLGTVATQVNGSMVYSSDPVRGTISRSRWGGPAQATPPIIARPGGSVYPQSPVNPAWSAGNSPYGSTPQNPTGSALATAQALLQANPSLLNATQWTLLQQAGLVANTVPYSSASQVNTSSGAVDPATGQTYASELAAAQAGLATTAAATTTSTFDISTMLSTAYLGLPLYLWLAGGVGVYLFMGRKGRR